MKSLQDYIDIYNTIAKKLNIQGDSVEVLTQLLANASYISEVENVSYVRESSLEKATLINSKIQHCMNDMYSVFRGRCPRVIINIKPTKYFSFNLFDEIISSNTFSIYYLGYIKDSSEEHQQTMSALEGITYSPITIPPSLDEETYTIVGLLSKETINNSWNLDKNNTYYVDCFEENLSGDMWVKINGDFFPSTRIFSDHIVNGNIFDLTTTNFGSRLYVADILRDKFEKDESITPGNTKIEATYFKYSELSGYNESELKRINVKGAELVKFKDNWLDKRKLTEFIPGVCYLPEVQRDNVNTIHYKANRDRYVNSIFRTNNDVGIVLEEMYPDKVKSGGTSYKFITSSENSSVQIYYVPQNRSNILSPSDIQNFISTRSSYFITDIIDVVEGSRFNAIFNIDIELYQSINIDKEIGEILRTYEEKFEMDLDSKIDEIKSLISKISNVKKIIDLNIVYTTEDGSPIGDKELETLKNNLNRSYFEINYVINSVAKTTKD